MKRILSLILAALLLSTGAYADVKISNLPAGGSIGGTEAVPVVQGGVTVKTTPSALNTYTQSQLTSSTIIGKFTGCSGTQYLGADGACHNGVTFPISVANGGTGTTTLTGLFVGNGTSPFTPADFTDVRSLWGGSCTGSGTFLKANGNCSQINLTTDVTAVLPAGQVAAIDLSTAGVGGIANTLGVTHGGTGATTLSGVLLGNGTSAIGSAASSDVVGLFSSCTGSRYLGADGACHVAANGSVTSVALTVPSGFSVTGSPITSSGTLAIDGVLNVSAGGTGAGTFTGLVLGNGTSAMSSYGGTSCTNQFPRSLDASGVATCATVANTDLANSTITINGSSTALGGTRTLSLASTDFANQGTTTTVLHGNASGNPSFGAVSLTADVTGILPALNGGTGNGFFAVSGPATSVKTFTLPNASSTILTDNALVTAAQGGTSNGFFAVSGPASTTKTFTFPNASSTVLTSNAAVTVAQGGTGVGTLTAHGVLLGEGTSNVSAVAAMAADTLLQGQGATSDPAAVSVTNCGDSTHALAYSTSTHTFSCQNVTGSGGTPAGSSTQIQYNTSNAFDASSTFTWTNSTSTLNVGSTATPGIIAGAAGSASNGAALTIQGGTAGATNNGGAGKLLGGAGGATSGNGGFVQVKGGIPVSGNGGQASVIGSDGVGSNMQGGNGVLQAGAGTGSGAAGLITITGGASASADGGEVDVNGGTASTSGNGGAVVLTSGGGAGGGKVGGNIKFVAGSGGSPAIEFSGFTATGAQTATFSATNKPGSATGAPALWLKVVVSGTTYWMPLFAN